MKVFVPDTYPGFSCIADRCRHSCCVGWEIDIDPDTLSVYENMQGQWGKRFRENITWQDHTAFFKLKEGDRCPFLKENGLCEIILALGENALCQICSDHPRYRNFYSDRIEMGLGLCCEEAARITLSKTEPVRLIEWSDDGALEDTDAQEQFFLKQREALMTIAQNRLLPLEKRVEDLCAAGGFYSDNCRLADWKTLLLSLERMDDAWACRLEKATDERNELAEWEIPFEQLLVYLLLRHMAPSLEDGLFRERLAFVVLMWKTVSAAFFALENQNMDELIETVRLYSSEIEYSDENIEKILDAFSEKLDR